MTEFIKEAAVRLIAAATELHKTSLIFPIYLAVMWRGYAKTLSISAILNALVLAAVASLTINLYGPESVPSFLDQQNAIFQSVLRSFPANQDLIRSWHLEQTFLSHQAAIFGFALFSTFVTRNVPRPWYKDWGLFFVLFIVVSFLWTGWFFILKTFYEAMYEAPLRSPQSDPGTFRHAIEYLVDAPVTATSYAMTTWVLGCFAFTFVQSHKAVWTTETHYRLNGALYDHHYHGTDLRFCLSGIPISPSISGHPMAVILDIGLSSGPVLHESATVRQRYLT